MNDARIVRGLTVCLAVVGFCLPQPLLAAVQTDQSPSVTDVALRDGPRGSVLIGWVLDQKGAAQPNVLVALHGRGQKLAEARTDGSGRFVFNNARGGVYQLVAGGGVGAYRVWAPQTAPPSAQRGAIIITGKNLIRGQSGLAGMHSFLSHPLVIAGIVATAVAVPVAIHNSRRAPTSP